MEYQENEKNYQVINYSEQLPFLIHNITRDGMLDKAEKQKEMLEHWHSEVELGYTYAGHAIHYIDGKIYREEPGKLLITNSESIHKVISDTDIPENIEIVATVLLINYDFLKSVIPDLSEKYFLTEVKCERGSIREIIELFAQYADNKKLLKPYEKLFLIGKIYELLYLLCRDALADREEIFPINNEKNLERLRGIMLYVNQHYTESIKQQAVAKKFYFTTEYFSRFFRKNTGMTFKEYLMRVRVKQAKEEVLHTDKSMLEIAMDTGFTDSRSLIHAFKEVYNITPYHFRKKMNEKW